MEKDALFFLIGLSLPLSLAQVDTDTRARQREDARERVDSWKISLRLITPTSTRAASDWFTSAFGNK